MSVFLEMYTVFNSFTGGHKRTGIKATKASGSLVRKNTGSIVMSVKYFYSFDCNAQGSGGEGQVSKWKKQVGD